MLHEHLIAKTRPQTAAQNLVFWKKWRISVLSDRLFRIERSENGKFRDGATQVVWFRDMPAQKYDVRLSDNEAKIITDSCELLVRERREDCRVRINGELLPISNDGNLMGTYRTLDCCSGSWNFIENKSVNDMRDIGVCSRSGVAVISDSSSLTLGENGEITEEIADGSDEYVFAFGDDYRAAVKALYMITGATPLIPRFALGNWWSRYHDYSAGEYLRLMRKFKSHDIPITVATVDMDWHWSDKVDEQKGISAAGKNTPYYVSDTSISVVGWTGYSWNTELFPDYKAFLSELHGMNLKTTLNVHPAQGVRYFEDCYENMALAMGLDPKTEKAIEFDVTSPDFINNYFRILHKPYENDGVDFWWIDWQHGTSSKIKGLDPLWSLNHYHFLDNGKDRKHPLILSRYSGIGSHRYPLGFSGDTLISWETLNYLPYFTSNSSNAGYCWWSHDVGGHCGGEKSDEMFVRHVQLGVLSPINRLHNTNQRTASKEPWTYENGCGLIVKEWMKFRHSLIPYLYSAAHRASAQGVPLVEPLYYEYKNEEAYEYKNEYLFGGQLLVIPITEKGERGGYGRVRAWIPEGEWTDIFTSDKYSASEGGAVATLQRGLESIPVLVRAGGILPLSEDEGNSTANPKKLKIWAFQGNGAFELYEDSEKDEQTIFGVTKFVSELEEDGSTAKQTLTISYEGSLDVLPDERIIKIFFKDIDWQGARINIYKNGELTEGGELLCDCAACELSFNPRAEYTAEVIFTKKSRLEMLKERALDVLTRAEVPNDNKLDIERRLSSVDSMEKYVSLFSHVCGLPSPVKDRLLEVL